MKKKFREVIKDIKAGELWESREKTIECTRLGDILITYKDGTTSDSMGFMDDVEYTLKRLGIPVTFEDVLNSSKLCKVVHPALMEEHSFRCFEQFATFALVMERLSNLFDSDTFKDIVKNGEWYLSDKEGYLYDKDI